MESDLKFEKTEQISLVDFDRIINLFGKVNDKWNEKLATHLRISNTGIGVPKSASIAREIISDVGNFRELDYAAAYLPDSFYIKADFRNGKLLVRCRDSVILDSLLGMWQETVKDIDISRDLLKVAISVEGLRFIFSCLDNEGRLSEMPDGEVKLERSYFLQYMSAVRMSNILSRFASYLKENQNSDGGWNFSPDRRSSLLSTANALLMLISAGETDPIPSSIRFLISRREANGFWNQTSHSKAVVTSVITLSLMKSEKHDENLEPNLSKIRDILLEQSQGIENDSMIVDILQQARISLDDQLKKTLLERLISVEIQHESIPAVEPLISALIILHACGKSKLDPGVRKIIDRLIELRNPDGGWPSSIEKKTSSSYTTVATIVALNRMNYFG